MLTAARTLAIRHDAIPKGAPAMITVTIWHTVATDAEGRHTAMMGGYQPGHPMVCVFAYQAGPAGRSPEGIAEDAFAICNGHPHDAAGEEVSRRYYARGAAVAIVPRKLTVLQQVVLPSPPCRVAQIVIEVACTA